MWGVVVQEAAVGSVVLLGDTDGGSTFNRAVDEVELDLLGFAKLIDHWCCKKCRASVSSLKRIDTASDFTQKRLENLDQSCVSEYRMPRRVEGY